jgi:hypothetical protein
MTGVPRFSHVFIIVMENLSLSTLNDSDNASASQYIHGTLASYASGTDYHGVTHPSLPNYLALTSGQFGGVACDCAPTAGTTCSSSNCSLFSSNCGCPQSVSHLGNQLETAGKTWKDYAEDMGTACNTTAANAYAPKHVPFLYYDDVRTAPQRCSDHVVDYSGFAADLASSTPNYSLIAPNLTNDGHDPITGGSGNIMNADTWLKTNVPPILASDAYKNGGLLIVVWDEDDYSGLISADSAIPIFVMSPYAKASGYMSTTTANHWSLLATVEDGLGLPRLGMASGVQPLVDYFPAQ